MKRIVLLILVLLLILPVLMTGCAKQPEQTQEKVTLKFVRIGNDAAEATYWKRLIADFAVKNPDTVIEYDDAAIGEPMETKLNSMFKIGRASWRERV